MSPYYSDKRYFKPLCSLCTLCCTCFITVKPQNNNNASMIINYSNQRKTVPVRLNKKQKSNTINISSYEETRFDTQIDTVKKDHSMMPEASEMTKTVAKTLAI